MNPAQLGVAAYAVGTTSRRPRCRRPLEDLGDLYDGIDQAAFGIAPLLEWAERDGAKPPVDPED